MTSHGPYSCKAQLPGQSSAVRLSDWRGALHILHKDIPLGISAEQGAEVGRALLAAAAACHVAQPPAEGTRIENCHFPILKWGTGYSNATGLPVLMVEIPGGTQLALQFTREAAQECGRQLAGVAIGQKQG
jgi:hypothetical protein